MPNSPIIVLGMHRSGTSCLTGCLEQAGVYLGQVNRRATFNAKGNRENRHIVALNDAVLEENGAAWDRPPNSAPTWSHANRSERDRILNAYPEDRTLGFKDPRMLFTLDGWMEVFPEARFIGTFRHPVAVARSLHARSEFSIEDGIRLWLSYNLKLIELKKVFAFQLINFDWPADKYLAAVTTVCGDLGLARPNDGFDFFEGTLRHNAAPPELPEDEAILKTYEWLAEMSLNVV